MPEAVTTQGETLWIGTNRSAMRRVPYLVSSPEIADPVQPIDATNLASDARVYIPGLKDYSGDLVWEANSQRYIPGELRDLLAMDGCHVWAERRMPLVGTRVSLEGTASVTMSAASPDSVQRVTVRITPSSSMSVEEWSPETDEGYLYRIRVDDTGMNILKVEAGYGGRPLETVVTSSTRQAGAANIPREWDFNGGVGPFGTFYAAFNIDDYVAGTESEGPVCTEAGRLAYRLDPFDLGRTLAGTELVGTYNIMLVIPTVYWTTSDSGKSLYLSNRPSYGSVSGMVAYAHTATSGGVATVYPYIAIGVYEGCGGGGLFSKRGETPAVWGPHNRYKELANQVPSAAGCAWQMWNFYQWTLLKMMAYLVMGTKNSQWMLGDGPVAGSGFSTTGLADAAGPYADSTDLYDKVFVENLWGSAHGMIGDVYIQDGSLYVGNALGGGNIGTQASAGFTFSPTGWPTALSTDAATWDLPTASSSTDTSGDPSKQGDSVTINSGRVSLDTGGAYVSMTGGGIGYIFTYDSTQGRGTIGTRVAYVLNDYAVGLTDEAPASLMSAPLTLSMGQSTPDEEESAEPEEESAEPTEEPAEETPEESEDEPEEDMR